MATLKGAKKVEKVMGEFKRGTLKSSSGAKVMSKEQAIAIALSEAGYGKPKKKKAVKKAVKKRV